MRMRNARQSEAASRSASVLKHEVDVCGQGGHVPRRYLGGPEGEYRLSEVPFCEMRNAGQSAAASRSARVSKHQIHTVLDGEHSKAEIFEAPA